MDSIDKSSAYVIVGKIASTHGVKGWLKILSYTEHGPDIIHYLPWRILNAAGEWEVLSIEESKVQETGILAKFSGIDTPEVAKQLTGKTIAIERSLLPRLSSDEFYWSDLEGMDVININGQNLGKVRYLMATGSNDVLVVKGEKEHAIPYLKGTVIKEVDMAKRQILVDWEVI